MHYPERSGREDALIADFLSHHIDEYDRYSFSVRVGSGRPADPAHLPGVQRQAVRNSQMRIDMVGWQGPQATIFEVKERAIHSALGQLQTYAHLWMQDNPDALAPRLAVIARTIEPDMEGVFQAAGIPVYLYEPAASSGGTASGGTPSVNGASA
jgi:hypothetical protein